MNPTNSPTDQSTPGPAPAARRGRGSRPQTKALALVKAEEKAARQEMILLKTVCGQKAKQIAEELDISVGMVRSDLAAARRADMLLAARDKIQSLVPKAIAALEAHLEDGDKDVALLVLEGLGVIGKHVQVQMLAPQVGGGEVTYAEFRSRVISAKSSGDPSRNQGIVEQSAAVVGSLIGAEGTTGGDVEVLPAYLEAETVSVGAG